MKQYVIRRVGYCLLSLFLLSVTIFFFVRVTGDPATLLVEPGASEADIAAIHHQFGLDRPLLVQYWLFLPEHRYRRSRPVLLLPHAGFGAVPVAAAVLADARRGGDGLLAADRHPERHPRCGGGRRLLGQFRQGVRAARPVIAVLLGRAGDDPVLLGLSRLAAVVGGGDAAAPDHAGLCAGMVFRRLAYAADALLDARSARLGIHQAGPIEGAAAARWSSPSTPSRTR